MWRSQCVNRNFFDCSDSFALWQLSLSWRILLLCTEIFSFALWFLSWGNVFLEHWLIKHYTQMLYHDNVRAGNSRLAQCMIRLQKRIVKSDGRSDSVFLSCILKSYCLSLTHEAKTQPDLTLWLTASPFCPNDSNTLHSLCALYALIPTHSFSASRA